MMTWLSSYKRKTIAFYKKLGPGVVTGTSDDDPSGIATYSQAGATLGLGLLWTALLTYPLMYAMLEMSARIGIVCKNGLTGIIKKNYSKSLIYFLILFTIPGILLNIVADIAGMGAVANLLIPSIPTFYFEVIFIALMIAILIWFSYKIIASIMKVFCLALLCYFLVPFFVKHEWSQVLAHTFIPTFQFDKDYILLLVAVLGTTLSPYLFLWQASMSLEQVNQSAKPPTRELADMSVDVNTGMLLSNLTMYFIILTTGTVLFPEGIKIDTVEQAAQALKPLAGNFAYVLFSVGVLGVGFLSIPVLGGCVAYVLTEIFNWEKGLDRKFHEAREFYLILIASLVLGLLINIFEINPIQALIWTAIVYGITAPFFIAVIMHICNNAKIMGTKTNTRVSNWLGIVTFILMTIASVVFIIGTLFF